MTDMRYLFSCYNNSNLWTTQENSNDVLIRVQDDNPQVSYIIIIVMLLNIIKLQSLSSSLPLYGDVLSRLKTPPLPSIQSNITNSGTNFQSSKIINIS